MLRLYEKNHSLSENNTLSRYYTLVRRCQAVYCRRDKRDIAVTPENSILMQYKKLFMIMKRVLKFGVFTLALLLSVNAFAQNEADRILGIYQVEEDGHQSRVQFTKRADGKIYNVECSFDNSTTLRVKGSWGPISLSRYWKKIK